LLKRAQAKGAGWRLLLQVRLADPAIGTSNSDSRWRGHGRLLDIPAMSPEPWRQRRYRSSSAEVPIAGCNQAPRRKRTSRYDSGGDPSGDIEPDRATRRWHRPAPTIARAAPLLRERRVGRLPPQRRVGRLPPQRLRPVSWLASSCWPPEFIQVSRRPAANSRDLGFNRRGCAPFPLLLVADVC
jgi:hypothetical protein